MLIVKSLLLLSAFVFAYQFYKYATTRDIARKEMPCYVLGVAYVSFGTTAFVFHDLLLAFGGLYLIMLGLLLLAQGLDRKNKRIFIDRYRDGD